MIIQLIQDSSGLGGAASGTKLALLKEHDLRSMRALGAPLPTPHSQPTFQPMLASRCKAWAGPLVLLASPLPQGPPGLVKGVKRWMASGLSPSLRRTGLLCVGVWDFGRLSNLACRLEGACRGLARMQSSGLSAGVCVGIRVSRLQQAPRMPCLCALILRYLKAEVDRHDAMIFQQDLQDKLAKHFAEQIARWEDLLCWFWFVKARSWSREEQCRLSYRSGKPKGWQWVQAG